MHSTPDSLADMPLAEVAGRLGATTPAPGAGSAAGIVCALAAALVQMTAGFAGEGCAEIGARAGQLRASALMLADRDRLSYEPVFAAIRRPAEDPERADAITAALAEAAATPLAIARAASETARLAVAAAQAAGRHARGDGLAAAVLAEGACQAAALLAALDLPGTGDPRRSEAEQLVAEATGARQHAEANALGH